MVSIADRMKRINNCRDMISKATCPKMQAMWKRNYEKLLKTYWEEEGERILNTAGQVH
tara:strand:+ start:4139 stop:4312 length:174 start_codon:yes stop_codon:yes gene_type:complete